MICFGGGMSSSTCLNTMLLDLASLLSKSPGGADASLTGSGAVCDDSRTHGFWSTNNKEYHINFLELLAIFYALKCFASHLKSCDILLRVDNCTFLCQLYGLNQIPSFI